MLNFAHELLLQKKSVMLSVKWSASLEYFPPLFVKKGRPYDLNAMTGVVCARIRS